MVVKIVEDLDSFAFLLVVLEDFACLIESKVTLATVTTGVLGQFSRIFIVEDKINVHVKHGCKFDALFYVVLHSFVLQVDASLFVLASLQRWALALWYSIVAFVALLVHVMIFEDNLC